MKQELYFWEHQQDWQTVILVNQYTEIDYSNQQMRNKHRDVTTDTG